MVVVRYCGVVRWRFDGGSSRLGGSSFSQTRAVPLSDRVRVYADATTYVQSWLKLTNNRCELGSPPWLARFIRPATPRLTVLYTYSVLGNLYIGVQIKEICTLHLQEQLCYYWSEVDSWQNLVQFTEVTGGCNAAFHWAMHWLLLHVISVRQLRI